MDARFMDALVAYQMTIEKTIDTFDKYNLRVAASDPKVLAKTVDAAGQAMWLVMENGGLEGDGKADD
jgi:hypothetical protein